MFVRWGLKGYCLTEVQYGFISIQVGSLDFIKELQLLNHSAILNKKGLLDAKNR